MRRDTSDRLRKETGIGLKAARLAAGRTQMDVAIENGMNQSHVSEVEHGRLNVTLDTICTIAESLGVYPTITFTPIGPRSRHKTPKT
jgi:transcriptional regulator with XRE-family HTH domain